MMSDGPNREWIIGPLVVVASMASVVLLLPVIALAATLEKMREEE